MYIEERHQAILDIIAATGSISTSTIQKKFSVSYDSAKRDLRILAEKGLLKRTHGGAIPVGELSVGKPRIVEREKISDWAYSSAKRAAALIKNGDSVFIPHGEVGYAISELLAEGNDFTTLRVITASAENAAILSRNDNIRVIMLGGELVGGVSQGGFAVSMLSRIKIDMAFICAEHYSEKFGLSCDDFVCCTFLEAVIGVSQKVTLFLPSSARKSDGAISVCPAERIDVII